MRNLFVGIAIFILVLGYEVSVSAVTTPTGQATLLIENASWVPLTVQSDATKKNQCVSLGKDPLLLLPNTKTVEVITYQVLHCGKLKKAHFSLRDDNNAELAKFEWRLTNSRAGNVKKEWITLMPPFDQFLSLTSTKPSTTSPETDLSIQYSNPKPALTVNVKNASSMRIANGASQADLLEGGFYTGNAANFGDSLPPQILQMNDTQKFIYQPATRGNSPEILAYGLNNAEDYCKWTITLGPGIDQCTVATVVVKGGQSQGTDCQGATEVDQTHTSLCNVNLSIGESTSPKEYRVSVENDLYGDIKPADDQPDIAVFSPLPTTIPNGGAGQTFTHTVTNEQQQFALTYLLVGMPGAGCQFSFGWDEIKKERFAQGSNLPHSPVQLDCFAQKACTPDACDIQLAMRLPADTNKPFNLEPAIRLRYAKPVPYGKGWRSDETDAPIMFVPKGAAAMLDYNNSAGYDAHRGGAINISAYPQPLSYNSNGELTITNAQPMVWCIIPPYRFAPSKNVWADSADNLNTAKVEALQGGLGNWVANYDSAGGAQFTYVTTFPYPIPNLLENDACFTNNFSDASAVYFQKVKYCLMQCEEDSTDVTQAHVVCTYQQRGCAPIVK